MVATVVIYAESTEYPVTLTTIVTGEQSIGIAYTVHFTPQVITLVWR